MRWLLLVLLAACGFEHGVLPGSRDAAGSGSAVDARMIDAPRTIDAPPSACLSASTDMSGGHHYFKTANLSWGEAQAACVAVGGHLAKIETSAEDDFITATFTIAGYVWIGLQDPTDTNIYVWADLTPLGTYNGFPSMMPPASSGNCVDTNGIWDPYICSATNHGGVCECE